MFLKRILVVVSLLLVVGCTIDVPDIHIPDCIELGFNPSICAHEDAGVGDAGTDQDVLPDVVDVDR